MLYTKLLLDKFFMTDVKVEQSENGEYVYSFSIPPEKEPEIRKRLEYSYRHKSTDKPTKKMAKGHKPRRLSNYKRKYEEYVPIDGEIWAELDKYPGFKISSLGRVMEDGKILVPVIDNGYMLVSVRERGKNRKQKRVHRLVAEAFIPNPDNKPEVDHINTDKTDNRVENLRWATNFENMFKNELTANKLKNCPGMLKHHIFNTLKTDMDYMLRCGVIDEHNYNLGIDVLNENKKM